MQPDHDFPHHIHSVPVLAKGKVPHRHVERSLPVHSPAFTTLSMRMHLLASKIAKVNKMIRFQNAVGLGWREM